MKTDVKEVRKLVKKYLQELNIENNFIYKAREESLNPGFQMEADALSDTIVFDPKEIRNTFNDSRFAMQAGVTNIDTFIKILIVHEVGHLLDYKKNSFLFHNKGFEEQLEINAWKLGESLISDELLEEFNNFKRFSLDSYRGSGMF